VVIIKAMTDSQMIAFCHPNFSFDFPFPKLLAILLPIWNRAVIKTGGGKQKGPIS